MKTFAHRDKLWRATEIQDDLVDVSSVLDDQTKQAFKAQSKVIRDFLTSNPKPNSYQLWSLTNELIPVISSLSSEFLIETKKKLLNDRRFVLRMLKIERLRPSDRQ